MVSAAGPVALERRAVTRQFPIRQDVAPPADYKTPGQYDTSPENLLPLMRDRARVERLSGPVQGISPLKD